LRVLVDDPRHNLDADILAIDVHERLLASEQGLASAVMPDVGGQISEGARFAFGENWTAFIELLDDDRIGSAESSLSERLGDIQGLRFLDAGSGSGLFSLAARNLGADVVSFDYDPQSVACTEELRRRYHPDDARWTIQEGSALDPAFLAELGDFDVVYSWGVLHHTGDLRGAMGNMAPLVRPGGRLLISIYNDQGRSTKMWTWVKRHYNTSGRFGRALLLAAAAVRLRSGTAIRMLLRRERTESSRSQSMSLHRDLVDWVGGWPFEVAKPEQVFRFYRDSGFVLLEMTTAGGGHACNEFVFRRP
jgi:2-polyprenyl-6-hydroxyphenyl methylase/3-demethylubiquinone-9 3-methyltransferase